MSDAGESTAEARLVQQRGPESLPSTLAVAHVNPGRRIKCFFGVVHRNPSVQSPGHIQGTTRQRIGKILLTRKMPPKIP